MFVNATWLTRGGDAPAISYNLRVVSDSAWPTPLAELNFFNEPVCCLCILVHVYVHRYTGEEVRRMSGMSNSIAKLGRCIGKSTENSGMFDEGPTEHSSIILPQKLPRKTGGRLVA